MLIAGLLSSNCFAMLTYMSEEEGDWKDHPSAQPPALTIVVGSCNAGSEKSSRPEFTLTELLDEESLTSGFGG